MKNLALGIMAAGAGGLIGSAASAQDSRLSTL
jgi:hypothetical protein